MADTRPLDEGARGIPAASRAWLTRIGTAHEPLAPPANLPLVGRLQIGRALVPEDPWMSSVHAEIDEEGALHDLGSSNGTEVAGARTSAARLADGEVFVTGGTVWMFHRRAAEPPRLDAEDPLGSLNPEMAAAAARVRKLARVDVPVMLIGETGTGKEVFAERLHALSPRRGPYMAVNSGAIAPNLVAAELFGVERGAHSTADASRPGLVRAAEGGTLLLDEVGDMPREVQIALLRLLESKTLIPVGGHEPIRVDVRIVCATHRDLEAMVSAGGFRADLYARLRGSRIALSPLSARREDIGLLVGRLLSRFGGARARFRPDAYAALVRHDWPLNVRGLAQVVEGALALAEGETIERSHLPPEVSAATARARPDDLAAEIARVLALHRGNVSRAAKTLGKSRNQFHRYLKQYDIDPARYRE